MLPGEAVMKGNYLESGNTKKAVPEFISEINEKEYILIKICIGHFGEYTRGHILSTPFHMLPGEV